MKIIKLTDEQLKNLNIYLNRVDLKGTIEAMALTEIAVAISRAVEEPNNETQDENQGGKHG